MYIIIDNIIYIRIRGYAVRRYDFPHMRRIVDVAWKETVQRERDNEHPRALEAYPCSMKERQACVHSMNK